MKLKEAAMELTFRKILHSERRVLLGLYQHLNLNDPILPDDIFLDHQWADFLSDPKIACYIAETDEEIISSCTLVIIPNLTRGARPYGLIENVVTKPAHRKKGVGTKLLRFALSEAWNANCYKVMLLTGRKDEETLHFYEKAGFKRNVKIGFVAHPE
jgi:GNAT superfamily N-acetyltransferase